MNNKMLRERDLAREIVTSRRGAKEARAKLLKKMQDNDHFDFNIGKNWYRCRRIPPTVRRKKVHDFKTMTFSWEDRGVSSYIDIRRINGKD